jgi:small-conductance mechanosensitive channel
MVSIRDLSCKQASAFACSADLGSDAVPDVRSHALSPANPRMALPVRISGVLLLALLGVLTLAVGSLVYLTDRPAGHAALLPTAVVVTGVPLFGALAGCLPSFLHPFAFSLLTATAWPVGTSPAYGACIAWWLVNVAFEIAQSQGMAVDIASTIENALGHTSMTQPLTNFLLRGTFDPADLIAATAGAVAAAVVLTFVHRRERRDAQP